MPVSMYDNGRGGELGHCTYGGGSTSAAEKGTVGVKGQGPDRACSGFRARTLHW
jgi:hypothetical protein